MKTENKGCIFIVLKFHFNIEQYLKERDGSSFHSITILSFVRKVKGNVNLSGIIMTFWLVCLSTAMFLYCLSITRPFHEVFVTCENQTLFWQHFSLILNKFDTPSFLSSSASVTASFPKTLFHLLMTDGMWKTDEKQ